jgi:hypothetical protein
MSPGSARGVRRRPALPFLALALVAAVVAGACGSTAAPSFDPTGPCTTDGRVAGAYPDLEALIPKTLAGTAPKTLDSGRNCSSKELSTLSGHGLTEVRFAGGLWQDAAQSGVTLAVFRAPGLQSEWMAEWFEAGARAARSTGGIKTTKPTVNGQPGQRLDLVNGESPQTVITWPGAETGTVRVVIAAEEPEARIQAAIAAFQ